MRASHPTLLRLAVVTAALAAPGLAQACEFYRTADTRLEIFDLPDTGQGLAVSILPAGSSACIMESRTDSAGNTWDRLDFYMLENVRYPAAGWLSGGSAADAEAEAPGEMAMPDNGDTMTAAPSETTTGSKEAFFASHWSLDPAQSSFNFVSTKKGTVTEVHTFDTLSGSIDPDGTATVKINLESVHTGIDLRDVRMRFLAFQIDTYPEATITAHVDPASVQRLWEDQRINYDLPVTIDLHGQQKELVIPVVISRLGDHEVSVASVAPALVSADDFAMENGIAALSEAVGNIVISRIVPVSFNLTFKTNMGG